VISNGEDFGSIATPAEACKAPVDAGIVCDSVIISAIDQCKTLYAVCHITGGLAFRPETVDAELSTFDQKAFLCYDKRKKPAYFRGTIIDRAASDAFDTSAESSTKATGLGRQKLAIS
jgi:hypothetical protein